MTRILTLLLISTLSFQTFSQVFPELIEHTGQPKDNPAERRAFEKRLVQDPASGVVPYDELVKAYGQTKKRLGDMTQAGISGINWVERGPNNIGGRTRGLIFDPNDTQKRRVWAGGVAGGLWYNNDILSSTLAWTKINDFWDNLAVSCITYDPANTQVFYVGTGEGWYNGDAVQGGGIWKSTNGGTTWNLLASTVPSYDNNTFTHQQFAFQTIQKIVVGASNKVFAATQSGIWQSTNGGTTWTVSYIPNSSNVYSQTNFCSDLEIHNGIIYAGFGRGTGTNSYIFKSTNNGTNWTNITPIGVSGGRVELAIGTITGASPTDVIYAVNDAGFDSIGYFKKSINGGTTWTNVTIPVDAAPSTLSPDVTNGQAWYDLILKVHPNDGNVVYIGGASFARSVDGGATWFCFPYGSNVHPDHHAFEFRPNATNEMIMGNDGGVYYSSNFGNKTISASSTAFSFSTRNSGFNITQPYAVAMKNVNNDGYLLFGNQDNGTVKISSAYNTVGAGTEVLGGDGMLCFIDQDNPSYQFGTFQYNNYRLFNSSGVQIANLTPHIGGFFLNPADYDSPNNTLYSVEGIYDNNPSPTVTEYITRIARYVISGTNSYTYNYFQIPGSINTVLGYVYPSFIRAGLTANTLFIGTHEGYIYKLTGITGTNGSFPTATIVYNPQVQPTSGSVSCIEIGANENQLLVTFSNYSVKSVFYTNNGGTTWTSKDEASHGLPNMPIRFALFNPLDRKQVFLATELGVWTTTDITAANPGWQPTNSNLANTRCDMLRFRNSDNTIAVATHGRGIFTTKLVGCPTNVVRTGNETVSETLLSKTYIKGNTANVIPTGVNKTYSAKTYVLLEPKFQTQTGAVFSAIIGGCN